MSKHDPYEGSEEERFQKALTKCRNCTHIKMVHAFLIFPNGRCVDSRVDVTGEYEECECREFCPSDNLEYLEWKYENRKSKKKRKK